MSTEYKNDREYLKANGWTISFEEKQGNRTILHWRSPEGRVVRTTSLAVYAQQQRERAAS